MIDENQLKFEAFFENNDNKLFVLDDFKTNNKMITIFLSCPRLFPSKYYFNILSNSNIFFPITTCNTHNGWLWLPPKIGNNFLQPFPIVNHGNSFIDSWTYDLKRVENTDGLYEWVKCLDIKLRKIIDPSYKFIEEASEIFVQQMNLSVRNFIVNLKKKEQNNFIHSPILSNLLVDSLCRIGFGYIDNIANWPVVLWHDTINKLLYEKRYPMIHPFYDLDLYIKNITNHCLLPIRNFLIESGYNNPMRFIIDLSFNKDNKIYVIDCIRDKDLRGDSCITRTSLIGFDPNIFSEDSILLDIARVGLRNIGQCISKSSLEGLGYGTKVI